MIGNHRHRTGILAGPLLFILFAPAVAQPMAHQDYLVENPADREFRGVVWISPGSDRQPSVIATEESGERRAAELPSQAMSGRVAIYVALKPREQKRVSLHFGTPDQILRLKAAYTPACDARLLGRGDSALLESDRVAYILRGSQIEVRGKLSAREISEAIGELAPLRPGPLEVLAAGPLAAALQAGDTSYTVTRGSRWTQVEAPAGGEIEISLPERAGESLLSGQHWIATFGGSPAVGLALYADGKCDAGARGRKFMLHPGKDGRVRYAFAAFWEREHRENVVEQAESDVAIPRVPGMERTKTNGRILLRPPLMQTREQFEERLRADVAQFANPPKATRIPLPPAAAPPRAKTYDDALRAILSRIRTVTEQGKGRFWFSSDPDGAPAFVDPKRNWGDGYWVSLLWDGFRVTGDEWFRGAALDANRRILGGENREFHVTGLNYWNGSARSYRETGDGHWRESGLRAADTMARIADPVTGLIPEYGRAERRRPEDPYDQSNYVKIDALVGLPILWWAYEETHEKRYLDTASRHLRFTLENLVEPDGAALQMLWHDPATARILGVGTHQGYGGNSRWARGLAWLIDGLPDAYRTTRDPAYRAQFERSAQWLERNLPEDLISWYDFDDQGIFWRYRDSGTSAICAYGVLRMSDLEPDRTLADSYRRFGTRLVNALIDRSLSPVGATDARPAGMLVGQTYTKPQEGEFIWGTYSLVRSLCWLREKGIGR